MEDVTSSIPAGLSSYERAFRVGTGRTLADGTPEQITVAVGVTRGNATSDYLPLKITARLIDMDGAPVELAGAPVVIPAWVHTILAGAVAEGRVIIENEMATQSVAAVERMQKHYVAMRAWFALPMEPSDASDATVA